MVTSHPPRPAGERSGRAPASSADPDVPTPVAAGAFGMVILSNVVIPGLENAAVAPVSSVPLRVDLREGQTLVPRAALMSARVLRVSPELFEDGVPAVVLRYLADEQRYHFEYYDGTEFLIDHAATRLRGTWRPGATLEDTATYLLGPVIAFVLRLRGLLTVHASAVEMDGRAVLVVGPSGAGKSTTAAAFALNGWAVLTDDVAVIALRDDGMDVVPSYPRVRLWDDSVRKLLGRSEVLPLLTPTWDKRYLPLGTECAGFTPRPLPLAAIFLLREREDSDRAPRIEEIPPLAAFPEIIGNLLTNRAIPDESAELDFRFSASLVHHVPVFALTAHADSARLGELCRVVARRVAGLSHPAAPAAPADV